MDKDIEEGKPVIIKVCGALADNKHQWIVSIPESVGDSQKAVERLLGVR